MMTTERTTSGHRCDLLWDSVAMLVGVTSVRRPLVAAICRRFGLLSIFLTGYKEFIPSPY
jgi:hypothetical protein